MKRTTVVNKRTMGPATPDDVYIGRPSVYGNRYSHKPSNVPGTIMVSSRAEAIRRHREDLLNNPELVERIRRELAGKRLTCFCHPEECHGDTLAKIANGESW